MRQPAPRPFAGFLIYRFVDRLLPLQSRVPSPELLLGAVGALVRRLRAQAQYVSDLAITQAFHGVQHQRYPNRLNAQAHLLAQTRG
jgi:hypothetical protein